MSTFVRIAALLLLASSQVPLAAETAFPVSDAQLARLGVRLAAAEPVELVEIAAAPAVAVAPPARRALVSAPVAGVIARLLVAEGDEVASGQPLAEIESVEHLEHQRDFLDAAAAAELAAAQETRDRGLFADGAIAERRVAETAAAAKAAAARLGQARAQLELAGLTAADLNRLAERRALATRVVLRAPLAGVVAAVHGDVGGRVDALDPVLAVIDLDELWLELRVAQEIAATVATGMHVIAEPPGAAPVTGLVTTVGQVVDPATQTVLVRAAVDNAAGSLRAGQLMPARLVTRPAAGSALALPAAAATRDGDDVVVFVRDGGDVQVRRVEVLADNGARVFVGAGLDTDAAVAVEGISALKALWLSGQDEGG